MSNIDKIFGKLIDYQAQAPDVWGKLDAKLNNNPTNSLESNSYKKSNIKLITSSNIFKGLGIVVGCIMVGVVTYLYISTTNNKDELSKSKIETIKNQNKPTIIFAQKNNLAYKPINNIEAEINLKEKLLDSQSQIQLPLQSTIEYNINDEKESIINNSNSLVLPINSVQTSSPTVDINNIQETNLTQQEEKSPVQTLPELKIVQNVMTPNGDGKNDYFEIKNIDKYPDNSLVIFDGKGKIIYRSKGYKNNFDARNIPQGTYYYKLEYNNLGKIQTKAGSITVLRN